MFFEIWKKRKIRILEHCHTPGIGRISFLLGYMRKFFVCPDLLCGRLNRLHYGSCLSVRPSVRPSVCHVRALNSKTKRHKESEINANVSRVSSNRCANFQLNGCIRGSRIVCWHWVDIVFQFYYHSPVPAPPVPVTSQIAILWRVSII